MLRIHWFVLLGVAAISMPTSAAPFRNLGFDEADTNNLPYFGNSESFGTTADLLPAWQLFQGDVLQTNILFDDWPVGGPGFVSLYDSGTNGAPFFGHLRPEGRYAIVFGYTGVGTTFSLLQTGDIPPGTRFLRFLYEQDPFTVSVNGADLPVQSPVGYAPSPQHALVDISKFAGQTVQLRLTTQFVWSGNMNFLDSLEFIVPILRVRRTGTELVLNWATVLTGYVLESAESLVEPVTWQPVTDAPVVDEDEQSVTVSIAGAMKFYRLVKSPGT